MSKKEKDGVNVEPVENGGTASTVRPRRPNFSTDRTTIKNLKGAMYKLSMESIPGRVMGMAVVPEKQHVIVSVHGQGAIVYKLLEFGGFEATVYLGEVDHTKNKVSNDKSSSGPNIHEICVGQKYLCYIKDHNGSCTLCIHNISDVLESKKPAPKSLFNLLRRAPMVMVEEAEMVVIGGAAWNSSSWTSNIKMPANSDSTSSLSSKKLNVDCNLRAVCVRDFSILQDWVATDSGVFLLRQQATTDHNMVAVADIHKGIKVYDMLRPTAEAYELLYELQCEQLRNFELVGNSIGVFHKHEPNCCFWNMTEQKTILVINIQEQVKELNEHYYGEEEDDQFLALCDDDHVTSTHSIQADDDYLLLYGTQSGCLFGMSVNSRGKVFQIPCPLESAGGSGSNNAVTGLGVVSNGTFALTYEKLGLMVLDFSTENPPDRPPTRSRRSSSSLQLAPAAAAAAAPKPPTDTQATKHKPAEAAATAPKHKPADAKHTKPTTASKKADKKK